MTTGMRGQGSVIPLSESAGRSAAHPAGGLTPAGYAPKSFRRLQFAARRCHSPC